MKLRRAPPSPMTLPRKPAAPPNQKPTPGKAVDSFESAPPMKDFAPGYATAGLPAGGRSADFALGAAVGGGLPTGETPAAKAAKNADPTLGDLVHPGDLDKRSKLGELINPRGEFAAPGLGPGQTDLGTLSTDASEVPTLADGRNATSKTEQQSDGEGIGHKYYQENPLYYDWVARQRGAKDQGDVGPAAADAGMTKEEFLKHADHVATDARGGMSVEEFEQYAKDVQDVGLTKEQLQHLVDHPDEPVETPLPDAIDNRGSGDVRPIGETIANQHRQVVLPGDDGGKPTRLRVDRREAFSAGLGQRTDGRIDYGDSGGPAAPGQGSVKPPAGSGIEQVDGSRPGNPKHPDQG